MNVLVTGASGFIGSNLVKKLRDNNHTVTALVNQNDVTVPAVKIVRGDIAESLLVFEDKYDIVYHLAAVTPLEKNKKVQQKINFKGTINFYNKIKDTTNHLVYVSGLGVFGRTNHIIDESTAKNPDTDFAKIRLAAERHLEKECTEKNIGFCVAYLGEVYGNGGWFTSQILPRLKKGKFKMPKSGDYFRSFVHIDDAVNALYAIGQRQSDESFIVTDSNPALFKDFINFTADKVGVSHPGNIPTFLAKAVLGGDFIKLLTTPTKASNKKISEIIKIKFPTYQEGLTQVLAEINQR